MKKRLRVIATISGLFVVFLFVFNTSNTSKKVEALSQNMNMDISKGKLISYKQEGFVDIETFAKIEYPLYDFNGYLNEQTWKECPLEPALLQDLRMLLEREDFNEITIENGYYKVIEKDVSLLKVMIYDTNKEILYYYYVR